jgi:hypothetical protein
VRIPLDRLVLKPNVSAGANILVVASLAHMLRSTTGDPPPITVRAEGDLYRILDGRHRFLAAVMAGRADVLAQLDEPQPRQETAMTERAPEPTADTPDPDVIPDPDTAPEGQGDEPLDAGDDA